MKSLSLLLGASLLVSTAAYAKPVTIAGTATNGTTGKALANVKVELVQPRDGNARRVLATTSTDATGRFSFPAKEYKSTDLLMVSTKYQNFEYWRLAFDGGNKLKDMVKLDPGKVNFKVFNSSTAAVPISFTAHHIAISSSETGIKCVERIVVQNAGKTTFLGIGKKKTTIMLDIPKTAKNVKLDPKITDAQLVETTQGWGLSKIIPPDDYSPMGDEVRLPNAIIVNYDMDWPSSMPWAKKVDLSRTVHYPTKFFFVARTTEDKELEVTAPKLSADEEQQLPIDEQMETRIVNAIGAPMMPQAALKPDTKLDITVGKPGNPLIWGFAGLTLAICLFIPVAMTRPKRDVKKVKSSEPSSTGFVYAQTSSNEGFAELSLPLNGFGTQVALSPESQELIEKIADLDDKFEAGQVDNAVYQSQRAEWKKQLVEKLGTPVS